MLSEPQETTLRQKLNIEDEGGNVLGSGLMVAGTPITRIKVDA